MYGVVNAYLLPLAVPLLLFSADLRCAIPSLPWGGIVDARVQGGGCGARTPPPAACVPLPLPTLALPPRPASLPPARRVLRETGRLLGAFTWGAFATMAGSLLAFWLMPLRGLGADGWKVAAALTARHIGGSVNYVAVSEALALSPSARMAG